MKQNRGMFIGSMEAGKSTLAQALLGYEPKALKTQSLTYKDWIVDTPGEYTENPMFYKNIMATSLEVTHVLFVQDATKKKVFFPPNFSTGLNKLPIGVVTKADHVEADISKAVNRLRTTIPKGPIVITSAVKGMGLKAIKDLVACNSMKEMEDYVESQEGDDTIFMKSFTN
ncbi:ethanolamine utilization protein EutP [Pontibacillus yanchengensis]|uniref:Ethanolamine utilization protein EutP n=1 Tax=Pontibacillus yanchengensis TaxID=462910 RepID=A0ACC7VLD1_9BACI|nr:EutP/PduV family microcompartment system protein [Pontibacillus yanchengensis]MYL55470.1 ethanolamine utilization protein EutP [Pontibacillus yanchengensis]